MAFHDLQTANIRNKFQMIALSNGNICCSTNDREGEKKKQSIEECTQNQKRYIEPRRNKRKQVNNAK